MFFGSESIQKEIIEKANRIAREHDMRLIYGTTTGSISKGIQAYDSDYDIRFLFVRNSAPNKLYTAMNCKEEDIIYRYFTQEDHSVFVEKKEIFDRIAFWEFSSFLQFLIVPQIGKETKDANGLYYIVEHTFLSPFTWDPYGIQESLQAFIQLVFKPQYSIPYYQNLIKIRFTEETELINAKDYVDAVWAAMSILWLLKFRKPAPLHFYTLLTAVDDIELREGLVNLINYTYENIKNYCIQENPDVRSIGRHYVDVKRNKKIDDFINMMKEKGSVMLDKVNAELSISGKSIQGLRMEQEKELLNRLYNNMKFVFNPNEVMGILEKQKCSVYF